MGNGPRLVRPRPRKRPTRYGSGPWLNTGSRFSVLRFPRTLRDSSAGAWPKEVSSRISESHFEYPLYVWIIKAMNDTLKLTPAKARALIFAALTGAGTSAQNARYFTEAILDTE